MNSRHLSLPQKDTPLSFATPVTSPILHPKEVLNTQEDYVTELKKKYNQRLMKPLQLNQRLKVHGNLGVIDSGRERRKLQQTLLPLHDVEGKYLVKQFKELSHLAAVHDKKWSKTAKGKTKKIQNQNLLQQHLGEDICDYIKAVNDRAAKIKKVRSLEDTKLYNEAKRREKQEREALEFDTENKDPLLGIGQSQPQLQAEDPKNDANDLKLRLKQMNSNTQFRHSQRKLLFLRSMEASIVTSQQEETGESINGHEVIRELKRQDSTISKQEISPVLPGSVVLNDRTDQSIANIPDPRGGSFMRSKSKSSLHTLIIPNRERMAPVKSYDLVFSKKDRKSYFIDTGAYGDVSSIGVTSTDVCSSIDPHPPQPRPLEMDLPVDTDLGSHGDSDFTPHGLRMLSQPNFKGVRTPEIPEKEEDEFQTTREVKLEYASTLPTQNDVMGEQEKKASKRTRFFRTDRDGGSKGLISEDSRRIALYYDKESGKRIIAHVEDSRVDEIDMFARSPKDEFRSKLLENQKKTKSSKLMTFHGSFNEVSTKVQKGWLSITQNLLEPTKWKGTERLGKRGKSKKIEIGQGTRSTKGERAATEVDQGAYLRDISSEKPPLKQEMQGLLTRYGYKDSVIEIENMTQAKPKTPMRTGSDNVVNKERLVKIEKFLEQAHQKATKVSKVD